MTEPPPTSQRRWKILGVATQGSGGDDEARLKALLEPLSADFFPFDRRSKRRSGRELYRAIRRDRPDLVVIEGSGIFGGLAVLKAKILAGVPFILSSGDAIGPFVRALRPLAGPAFSTYEKRLCRQSAGFIGWSPYLAGRALTYGAPRAMTAAGWAPFPRPSLPAPEARTAIRRQLGIPEDHLVYGIVGSLATNRIGYCYGYELVEALGRVNREDAHAVIAGDGAGLADLKRRAGQKLGKTIHIVGRVPRESVPDWLAAFDAASLPQTVDAVGSFRYTTKLSEYLAAGLPIITGRIPLAYDLDGGWIWRLPGAQPWNTIYIDALANLIENATASSIKTHRVAVPRHLEMFDRVSQVARVVAFISEILEDREAEIR